MDNSNKIEINDIVEVRANHGSYAGQVLYLPFSPGDCIIIKDRYNGRIIQTYGDFSILLTKKNLDSAQKPV